MKGDVRDLLMSVWASPKAPLQQCGAIRSVTTTPSSQMHSSARKNEIVGEMVANSYKIRQSNLKRKHDDDYHGNFNTEQFEKWFSELCTTLAEKYGLCNSHMDGAPYHKNQTNSAPTTRTLKLVRANKPTPKYQATHITTSHGHLVYFTPPYHPELQPIELIWAHVKNQVANDPASSMQELRLKIDAAFDTIKSDTWINAFRRTQKVQDKYIQETDECKLASDDEEVGEDYDSDDAGEEENEE
ncbi:Hypothetical protein PHPALM_20300 [Phytophthora palmivora]|uniref:Tc1-like transposase DDE domain-containing protein n=1 Tax=Phytophthora palmivora TaxID=4796 RepID=A0A2P4XF80_9STRA|nr:Hypothetical protein PHPALM_20300 [Phytophthora palmivora]